MPVRPAQSYSAAMKKDSGQDVRWAHKLDVLCSGATLNINLFGGDRIPQDVRAPI
jgi:hypothetical protein